MKIFTTGSFDSVHFRTRAESLALLGHDVLLVTPTINSSKDRITTYSPKTNGPSLFFLKPLKIISEFYNFRKILRIFNPDIIHIHFAGGPYAALACLWAKAPIIESIMGGDVLQDEQPHPTRASTRLTKVILDCASAFTVKSQFLAQFLNAKGREVVRVMWGIDRTQFHPNYNTPATRDKYKLDANDLVIFSPRIMEPIYNSKMILVAFKNITTEFENSKLLMVSKGRNKQYRDECLKAAEELGLKDKVRFLPDVDQKEMPNLYNLAAVTVSIAESDGLPQSLFEAMACKSPIILSKLDRYKEVVDFDADVLTTELNSGALTESLKKILSRPELGSRLRDNAFKKVNLLLDSETEAKKVSDLYEKVHQRNQNGKVSLRNKMRIGFWLALHYLEMISIKLK
jgi:glycosyltransferase involved in cell wall biosynthesis